MFEILAQNNFFQGLNKNGPQLLMLGGLAVVCFLLMRNGSNILRRRRKKSDVEEIRELAGERSRDSAFADAPAELLRWQVEMHNTGRDLKAELDTKFLALEVLLREARAERERLEATLKRAAEQR